MKIMNEDLEKLIENLPFCVYDYLNYSPSKNQLIEVVLDLGRRPEARFPTGHEYLSQKIISWQDLDYTTKKVSKFSDENRAGIERTLHRISCIRNRQFVIYGLTCRVGRSMFGTISVIRDLLQSYKSILLLGKPGVGKTTIIREIARVLADEIEKRVIIIDTSNEIAGESDIPHSGIGYARRMQVPKTKFQHQIMVEAVENHMPQVIIIDEISTELEVIAARTIAEKGIQLVGTTHGSFLKNLIKNPLLVDLIGGIQYVTISDEEAKLRKTQKSILERKTYPAFEVLIEITDQSSWTIHEDVKTSIDLLLRGDTFIEQIRYFSIIEKIQIKSEQIITNDESFLKNGLSSNNKNWESINQLKQNPLIKLQPKMLVIYPYSLSNNLLKEVLLKIGIKFILTNDIQKASIIIGLKKHIRKNFSLTRLANKFNIPTYSINYINYYQLTRLFSKIN